MNYRSPSLVLAAALTIVATIHFLGSTAVSSDGDSAVQTLRKTLAELDVTPLEPAPEYSEELLKLGQALFFDPVIGGNRDVSCATCHHPTTFTADGRSRAVGTTAYVTETGKRMPNGFSLIDLGDGEEMLAGFSTSKAPHPFTPRNSPEIFNRGDSEWRNMFWDNRVHKTEDGKFAVNTMRLAKSPGLYQVVMPDRVEHVLTAQAMMPVLSDDEMRGTKGETDATGAHNEIGQELGQNEEKIWQHLMKRVLKIDKYREMFGAAFPGEDIDKLHFAFAAEAIAAFEIDAYTLLDSPWDKFLVGDDSALNPAQLRGAQLFYGRANCVECHSGRLMTDQEPHNIGVVPIGPGPDPAEDADLGIAHRSNAGMDQAYQFRTPPLRNVELTGPFMHNGAYSDLEAAVRHHFDPLHSLENYDPAQLEPEFRGAVHSHDEDIMRGVKRTLTDKLPPIDPPLSDAEVGDLMAFLKSLTSPSALDLSHTIPESVPSGLELVAPLGEPAKANGTNSKKPAAAGGQ